MSRPPFDRSRAATPPDEAALVSGRFVRKVSLGRWGSPSRDLSSVLALDEA